MLRLCSTLKYQQINYQMMYFTINKAANQLIDVVIANANMTEHDYSAVG